MLSTLRRTVLPVVLLFSLMNAVAFSLMFPAPTAAQTIPVEATPIPVIWNLEGIPVAGARMGNRDAPVAVVVWGDYTCPGCARFALETMPNLISTYVAPGLVYVEFHDFPFRGPNAVRAAEAAACAADQDRFWPMHATLFANRETLSSDSIDDGALRELAATAGLESSEFDRCLHDNPHAGQVLESIATAKCLGIDSIPMVLVAGEAAAWHDWSALQSTIDRALTAAENDIEPELAADAARRATACVPEVATPIAAPSHGDTHLIVLELRQSPPLTLDTATLVSVRQVLQRRLDALGVEGQVTRRRDDGRILVRIDASADPVQVAHALSTTAQLEIVDTRGAQLAPGTVIETSLGTADPANLDAATYQTIVSGGDLTDVSLTEGSVAGVAAIGFTLTDEASQRLYDFTVSHIGEPMAIVIDKHVVSTPTIRGAIASAGIIEGIPPADVPVLIALMKAGALAVPVVVVEIS